MADLARFMERALSVLPRGVGIAERPKRQRPPRQDRHPDVLPKSRAERSVLQGLVERERSIEMRSPLDELAARPEQERPMRRCPIIRGIVAPCLSANARN